MNYVTLRRVLATSWIATGLVQPIWQRLDVPKGKREELARLTGIPATNLSAMNTGNLPMTPETATRIMRAVPGVSPLDLGAPELPAADVTSLTLAERLEELSQLITRGFLALGVAPTQLQPNDK